MAEKIVRTICFDCHSKCGVLVHVDGETITKVEGDPDHPVSRGMVCCKALSAQQIHAHPDRIKYPMRRVGPRGSGEWERITWNEAFDMIEDNMRRIIEEYGPMAFLVSQGTGRGSNHFHFRFDATFGTGGFSLSSAHVCLMPTLIPMLFTLGYFAHVDSPDYLNGKCCVAWGAEPFVSWPGLAGRQILEAKRNGSKLIVIDPRFTDAAAKADIWLQPRPASDLALALALTNVIVEEKLYDAEFCEKWTYGFDELVESVKDYTPEWAEEITWVPAGKIRDAARMMTQDRPTNFLPSLGAAVHENGMQTGRAIANLIAIIGDADAKGGNLSNRFWDIMLAPEITLMDAEVSQRMNDYPGIAEKPMLALSGQAWPHAAWQAMKEGKSAKTPVRGLLTIANDVPMCYEESDSWMDAMTHLDFIAVKDYFPNSMAHIADLLLPSSHWSERDGQFDEECYSDPCPFVVPQKAVDAPGECKDDWEVFLELGKRFDPKLWPWENVREMHQFRLKTFYDVDKTWEELQEDPYLVTYGGDKRVYKKYEKGLEREDGQPGFRTDTGRVNLYSQAFASYGYDPLPRWEAPSIYENEAMAQKCPLYLTTGGRVYPFYHSAWTNIPMQREINKEPFVEMHPDTAQARGISDGDWVLVVGPNGNEVRLRAAVTKGIDPRVVHIPRPGWKHACKELGLAGHGYDKANPNMIVPGEPNDGSYGTPPMRSWRCEIKKMEA